MPEETYSELSRKHVDYFLARERQQVEQLRRQVGSEIVDKLDRVTVRDVLYEDKESELAHLLGDSKAREAPPYQVMFSLESGRAQPRPAAKVEPRRRRRQKILQMQRAAKLALSRIKTHVAETGGSVVAEFWLTHSVLVQCNRDQLFKVTARQDVRSVSHNKMLFLLRLDVSRPLIQADQVEKSGFDGSGINVAVLDTGVDFAHFALTAVAGAQLDFTGEGTGDINGHGSHCAGIIASQDVKFRGVAPGCTIHDYKILNMFGAGTLAAALAGMQQATTDARDIMSNSWGASHADGLWVCPDGTCAYCTAANNAVAAGIVFVAAAGNDNNDTCKTYDTHIGCPGHATDAITVAASDDTDNMASFSSIGPTADGRAKPDITAPGVDIISVRATTGNDMRDINGNTSAVVIDDNWIQVSGTSQATPHVAGVCALMLEKNAALTPANIKSTLAATAVNIGASANEMGSGRVDALAAVNAV